MERLTREQEIAFRNIKLFITSSKKHCFILIGYAGTGKTFLLKKIADWLANDLKRPFQLLAPTGRGARILKTKTGYPALTIHSAIYDFLMVDEYQMDSIVGDYVDNNKTNELQINYINLKLHFDINNHKRNSELNKVLLIDEASLISDIESDKENIKFGSGQLLKDLLTYAGCNLPFNRAKIIFVGDSAQLPPVNMDTSPALDIQYLKSTYSIDAEHAVLREVVRHSYSSKILAAATRIRENIEKNILNELFVEADGKEIVPVQVNVVPKLAKRYYKPYIEQPHSSPNFICITHSNKSANKYNEIIRSALFDAKPPIPLRRGDWLVVVQNNRKLGLSNGDLVWVSDVKDLSETRKIRIFYKKENKEITLSFRDISVVLFQDQNQAVKIDCKILENALYSESADISGEEFVALYADFRNRYKGLSRKDSRFNNIMLSDPYLNALRANFGFAITCHKAQGGEWDNVLVFFERCRLYLDVMRWTYTALTRAKSKLYGIDLPNIKPWSDVSTYKGSVQKDAHPDNKTLNSSFQPPAAINSLNIENNSDGVGNELKENTNINIPFLESFDNAPHFLRQKHVNFAKSLAEIGGKIMDVTIASNDYYVRYKIRYLDSEVILNVNFDKEGNFTPQIITNNPAETESEKLIKECFLKSEVPIDFAPSDTTDITYELYVNLIKPNCEKHNINIIKLERFPFGARYHFLYDQEESIIDFTYDKKGKIIKVNLIKGKDITQLITKEGVLINVSQIYALRRQSKLNEALTLARDAYAKYPNDVEVIKALFWVLYSVSQQEQDLIDRYFYISELYFLASKIPKDDKYVQNALNGEWLSSCSMDFEVYLPDDGVIYQVIRNTLREIEKKSNSIAAIGYGEKLLKKAIEFNDTDIAPFLADSIGWIIYRAIQSRYFYVVEEDCFDDVDELTDKISNNQSGNSVEMLIEKYKGLNGIKNHLCCIAAF